MVHYAAGALPVFSALFAPDDKICVMLPKAAVSFMLKTDPRYGSHAMTSLVLQEAKCNHVEVKKDFRTRGGEAGGTQGISEGGRSGE